jgi:dTDP-4-dehydrorhamnose 3,5-epimerase
MLWHTMSNFSPDCVILVLADAHYDESDYIRDYDVFRSMVWKKRAHAAY